ncbi:hypothetical protein CSB45_11855 [candidate division KSB3 bacterium]|uniref:Sulfatase-modifying factor enzyme-like domain-containing protein n=1 Tax=candidate division KSB3 bacterium TaxID=2044937 RepID=A0A2G6E3Q4_9BACT|nr:MAG: hypothetical protein CSB45_11855 [candidate division KSB3 bacterium]PIE29250.1 MAG: hypothetical protein CSA57_09595 [candidate division KSB3 bacterium]
MSISNPYVAGNPVHGHNKFIGRDDILQDVLRSLKNPETNSLVLFGQRRIGKTSVMLHVERTLREEGRYTPVYFDLQNKAALSLKDVLYQMGQKVCAATGTHLPAWEQFDRSGQFFYTRFIPSVIEGWEEHQLVLLLDEFDVLDMPYIEERAGRTFFPFMQRWLKVAQDVQFVFVLGRRPEELSTNTLAAFKNIPSRKISLMPRDACEKIIRQSEQNESLFWSEDAVERLWYWTQGHPYFTQLLCSEIWDASQMMRSAGYDRLYSRSGQPQRGQHIPIVRQAAVDASLERALEQGANAFQWIWNSLPPAERVIMAAIAECQDDEISLDTLTDILRRSKVSLILRELKLAPETLVLSDLLRRSSNDHYRFAVPMLRRWVSEEKALRRVKAELDNLEPLAESLYRSGEGFYKMGKYVEAERLLRNALNVNPNHFRAQLLLGQSLLGQGKPAEAVDVLELAYQFDRRSAQSNYVGALLALADEQRGKEQLQTYNRILGIEPNQVIALKKKHSFLLNAARVSAQKGDFETALKLYRYLGDQDGINSVTAGRQKFSERLSRAEQHERHEEWKEAIRLYRAVLKEFPDREDWQERLAAAKKQKRLAEYYFYANAALQQDKLKLAQKFFAKVVAMQPEYKDALRYLLLTVTGIDLEEILKENRLARGQQRLETLDRDISLEMVFIPAGSFLMGSPDSEEGRFEREGPQHTVSLQSFYLSKYPITQAQWSSVMGSNPARFAGSTRPVESVNWYDALSFCERLSELSGRHYRLPSEAEWEYACRAGTKGPFYFGKIISFELANYDASQGYKSAEPVGEFRGETTEVGSFLSNRFGLCDMHGNVLEWCADYWHQDYTNAPEDGAVWESKGHKRLRVLRGGAWDILPNGCRSAFRDFDDPANSEASYGFRVAVSDW